MFKIIAALVANFVAMAVLSGCATPAIAEPTPPPLSLRSRSADVTIP